MKKTMRFLGIVFALIMVLCCVQVAFAADYTLTTDTPISVTSKGYEEVYVTFVPEVSGTYKLVADSDSKFYISDLTNGDCDDNYHLESLDSYEAGEKYDFIVYRDNIWTKYDKIDITISLVCAHENKTVIPAKSFTCTEDGYGEKIICADCEWVIQDTYTTIARHVDADNDYVCDACGGDTLLISGTHNEYDYDYDTDEEFVEYTIEYKFYANGDLYIDGDGEYWLYRMDDLYDYRYSLYNSVTKKYEPDFRNIYIGKGITKVYSYYGEKFIVDPENQMYCSDSYGVLYSKDGKSLVAAPYNWKETSYDIPGGVERIEYCAFEDVEYLKTVTIPDSVTYVGFDAFNTDVLTCVETVDGLIYIGDILIDDISGYDYENGVDITLDVANVREGTRIIADCAGWSDGVVYNIPASVEIICDGLDSYASAYNVAEGNKFYSSIDGVLFNIDKTELVQYPGMAQRASYTVPAGIKKIGDYAIASPYLREIILPDGLEVIGEVAIYAPAMMGITLPNTLKRIEREGICINDNGTPDNYNIGIIIPESVEYIGEYSVGDKVAILNPDCYIEPAQYFTYVVGYKDSTAEAFDRTDVWSVYYEFHSISGLFHKHIDFGTVTKAPTCTENGELSYACPCGRNRAKTKKIAPSHMFYRVIIDGKVECEICNQEFDESVLDFDYNCTCICHSSYENPFKAFVFRFKAFFWKLFKVNRICECGRSVHYYNV